jgi:hypothetical protein
VEPKVDERQLKRLRGHDHLHWLALQLHKAGTQDLMPAGDFRKAAAQQIYF